jgi:Ser/Thr protein kinase RdoA (MazF antagonist)
MGEAEARAALGAWGIEARSVARRGSGALNEHWLIDAADGPLLLRRYHPAHAPEATPYEHAALSYLKSEGWPVAAPIATAAGATLVHQDAGHWSLFPFLPGEPASDSPRMLQRTGALLALLHVDLTSWPGGAEQRPTFGRVTELDTYLETRGHVTFERLMERFHRDDPVRAEALRGFHERNQWALGHLGYDALPDTVVHGECFGTNVRFEEDDVTAILDFDWVHRDARAADIARSLAFECRTDGQRVQRWLGGYAAHADPPLSGAEIDVLPSLMIASEIWSAVLPLALAIGGDGGTSEREEQTAERWTLASVRASIDDRLPALEMAQPALRRAVRNTSGIRPAER